MGGWLWSWSGFWAELGWMFPKKLVGKREGKFGSSFCWVIIRYPPFLGIGFSLPLFFGWICVYSTI